MLRDCDRKTLPELELELCFPGGKSTQGKPVHAGSARRLLYHLQRRNIWVASFHAHPEPAPERHSGHACHPGTPRWSGTGQIIARPMMYLALSYDHRLVDGKQAVQFLITVKNAVENPVFEL